SSVRVPQDREKAPAQERSGKGFESSFLVIIFSHHRSIRCGAIDRGNADRSAMSRGSDQLSCPALFPENGLRKLPAKTQKLCLSLPAPRRRWPQTLVKRTFAVKVHATVRPLPMPGSFSRRLHRRIPGPKMRKGWRKQELP